MIHKYRKKIIVKYIPGKERGMKRGGGLSAPSEPPVFERDSDGLLRISGELAEAGGLECDSGEDGIGDGDSLPV